MIRTSFHQEPWRFSWHSQVLVGKSFHCTNKLNSVSLKPTNINIFRGRDLQYSKCLFLRFEITVYTTGIMFINRSRRKFDLFNCKISWYCMYCIMGITETNPMVHIIIWIQLALLCWGEHWCDQYKPYWQLVSEIKPLPEKNGSIYKSLTWSQTHIKRGNGQCLASCYCRNWGTEDTGGWQPCDGRHNLHSQNIMEEYEWNTT